MKYDLPLVRVLAVSMPEPVLLPKRPPRCPPTPYVRDVYEGPTSREAKSGPGRTRPM